VGPPLPDHLAASIATWRQHHPDWEHVMWGDRDLTWLRHRDLYDHAPGLVPSDAVGQFRADIARYEILERHGGLYVDCDTRALRPVDEALEGHAAFAALEDSHWVGNTYLAAEAHHPALVALVDGLERSVHRHAGQRPNRMTGPRYLTPSWRAHGCHTDPTAGWYPYSYRHVRQGRIPTVPADAWAAHDWDHTRQLMGRS